MYPAFSTIPGPQCLAIATLCLGCRFSYKHLIMHASLNGDTSILAHDALCFEESLEEDWKCEHLNVTGASSER